MRFFSILLAVLVGTVIYFWIAERDWLYTQMGIAEAAQAQAETPSPEEPEDGVNADGRIKVVARHSTAQMVDTAVILRGQTEALRQVNVLAETSSTVVSDPLRKGSFVEAGQPLCVLDPGTREASLVETRARQSEAEARKAEAQARVPEARARLTEAQARLEEALVNENAAVELSKGGYAADTRVKNARAAVAAARTGVEGAKSGLSAAQSGIQAADAGIESAAARVASAQKEIERLTIRAPFAGLLESDSAELGSLLQPGGLCATIIQLDPIKLVGFVPETEISRLTVGAPAKARLASGGDHEIEGSLTFLSRSADPNTRTFRAEIEVPNPEQRIRDGQTVEIMIAAPGAQAHLLPASALTLNDEGALGLRLVGADNIVQFAPVALLRDTPEGVWVTGLPEAADVIVVGQEFVTAGVEVHSSYPDAEQTQ